jgi:hypothetical protein
MTEAEWLACTNPYPMLNAVKNKASDRKLMLFSVACLRRIWHLLTDSRSRNLVEATERLVDGMTSAETRGASDVVYDTFWKAYEQDQLQDEAGGHTHEAVEGAFHSGEGAAMGVASKAAEAVGFASAHTIPIAGVADCSRAKTAAWQSAEKAERVAQAALLRDILGNPFRPVAADAAWRTSKVISLARTMYEERAFEQISELADALQKAGCADTAILEHCHRPGAHARGCWVVDLLLQTDEGMSEAEWLACADPQLMWWVLRPKPSRRKQQLFAAACCHRVWHLLTDERCRKAVDVLERLADGRAMEDEWRDARRAAGQVARDAGGREGLDKAAAAVETADCCFGPTVPAIYAAEASARPDEPALQASLLRDVVGNPFRSATLDPSWRTPAVLKVAQLIYQGKSFCQLPALAVALEQAGCQDPEILGHCRKPGRHVRGCWVVDLIVGPTSIPDSPRSNAMTASEWAVCTDADKMLYAIGLKASRRKLRLFACACCRRVWDYMTDERSRKGVQAAERYADGLASLQELATAREGTGAAAVMGPAWNFSMAARAAHLACLDDEQQFLRARHETRGVVRWSVVLDPTSQEVEAEKRAQYLNREGPLYYAPQREQAVAAEIAAQASMLRDIFDNPFDAPPAIDASWLLSPVLGLAQTIYDECAFERMPELAGALEQAGCDNACMLAHCRGPGSHVRGCCVVDRLLRKE